MGRPLQDLCIDAENSLSREIMAPGAYPIASQLGWTSCAKVEIQALPRSATTEALINLSTGVLILVRLNLIRPKILDSARITDLGMQERQPVRQSEPSHASGCGDCCPSPMTSLASVLGQKLVCLGQCLSEPAQVST